MAAGATNPRERAARVAVLEDQPFFSQLLSTILSSAGYDAIVVREGPALLTAVARRPPDLVVLDIDMPGMNGLEVLERLRRKYDREALPIMMASARGEHSYPARAKTLGADLFLKKPYSISQLIERVEALLARPKGMTSEVLL